MGRYPGRLVQVFDRRNNSRTQMRTYLVKARIYTIAATTHEGLAGSKDVHDFMSSFELL